MHPVLVTVSGRDRPGLTAALLDAMSTTGADILDAEQIVLRGHLTLCLLVEIPATHVDSALSSIAAAAADFDVIVQVDRQPDKADPRQTRPDPGDGDG